MIYSRTFSNIYYKLHIFFRYKIPLLRRNTDCKDNYSYNDLFKLTFTGL